jgi:cytochrome c oxidase subunit 1
MFGRLLNETMGKIHFYATFIGVYAIFTPMHFLGLVGNPRRYSDFSNVEYLGGVLNVHTFMTHAAYFTAAVQLVFVVNLFWSMKKGAVAGPNPWESTNLEWSIPSPPPFDNFAGVHPVVNHGPYEYAVPGAPKDYIMQTDPPEVQSHA